MATKYFATVHLPAHDPVVRDTKPGQHISAVLQRFPEEPSPEINKSDTLATGRPRTIPLTHEFGIVSHKKHTAKSVADPQMQDEEEAERTPNRPRGKSPIAHIKEKMTGRSAY